MKTFLLLWLLLPIISFAQLTLKEIKSIDSYATNMCVCVNDLMEELHPRTTDVILIMAEVGEEAAMKEIEEMAREMDADEVAEFVASFERMQDPKFLDKIEICDRSDDLLVNLRTPIKNAKGEANEYLMYVLSREDQCLVMKSLYELGAEAE